MNYLKRNSTTMTIASFYELHQLKKINYNPSCQRKSVWGSEEKSFLIDTIFKNFPIPPIFLHQGIEVDTGSTNFSVIDGKQRLLSIIAFIEGGIAIPENFCEGVFGDDELNGLYFHDLKEAETLIEYRKLFWRYQLPIEYIDTEEEKVIDNIFDRLNRNGIPLKEQELRKARYNSENLYIFIEKLSKIEYWKDLLDDILDTTRMLDVEFISELLFLLLENDILSGDPSDIDELYRRYSVAFKGYDESKLDKIYIQFTEITQIFISFGLDFKRFNINKVSHLYALWALAHYIYIHNIDSNKLNNELIPFYEILRSSPTKSDTVELYRKSMASNTKSKSQRKKRVESLESFLDIYSYHIDL